MSKDPLGRRSYRKSPGRQYGYDYDPLQSQSGSVASKPSGLLVQRPDPRRTRQFLRQSIIANKRSSTEDTEPLAHHEQESVITSTPPSLSVAHPKVTRRIRHTSQDLAGHNEQGGTVPTRRLDNRFATHSKVTRRIRHTSQDLAGHNEQGGTVPTRRLDNRSATHPKVTRRISHTSQDLAGHNEQGGAALTRRLDNRSATHPKVTRRISHTSQDLAGYGEKSEISPSRQFNTHSDHLSQPHLPVTRDVKEVPEDWDDLVDGDSDLDMLQTEEPVYEEYPERSVQPVVIRRRRDGSSRALVRKRSIDLPEQEESFPDDYDPDRIYEEGEELPPGLHVVEKHKTSRRGLLVGVGMGVGILAVGGVVAASHLAPKAGSHSNDTSHAVQEAFNRGVTQGADSARREMISALDSLEGFTLQGAIDAAKLTRVAYDVFVAPIVQIGSQLTVDFLEAMLNALKTARGWLAGVYQDNSTLAAIQRVLESWVDQVSRLPKQLNVITQTDLDGAQAYLAALQRKLADEKSKLDHPQPTSTVPASRPTPQSK
jgi:hypothetical protein